MRYFLMAQGQWLSISAPPPIAVYPKKLVYDLDKNGNKFKRDSGDDDYATKEVPDEDKEPENQDFIVEFLMNMQKAIGNINLRLHPSIENKAKSSKTAKELWEYLQTEYGKPGIAVIFHEFKGTMSMYIPNGSDPSLALDKLSTHFNRMEEANCPVPEQIQALLYLSKIPPSMDHVTQTLCQKDDIQKLDLGEIRRAVALAWETRGLRPQQQRYNDNNNNNQAQKLSAVRRPGDTPSFQQQQQPQGSQEQTQREDQGQWRGDSNGGRGRGRGRGGKYRGNRGGKNRQQAQPVEEEQQFLPPPSPVQSQFQFGHIASPMIVPSDSLAPKSVYPSFSKALDLAHRIGQKPTIQTVKRLEERLGDFREPPSRRPTKRRCPDPEVEVNLFCTDDEDETMDVEGFFEDSAAGPSGTSYRCAPITALIKSANISPTVTKSSYCNSPVTINTNEISCCPSLSVITKSQWMLDSGASLHFTFDINDFVDYKEITPVHVRTANSVTTIVSKGTVILALNDKFIRIKPVYHVPDLNEDTRLLSLGTFLRGGITFQGGVDGITLLQNGSHFITFRPRTKTSTIYVVDAHIQNITQTIFKVDFETIHRRLAHPSKEVLQKAGKYVKDFPQNIEIPESHICPGCAQGKMTDKSHPSTHSRATEPFELIHFDLKSFPIESYRKYKYAMVLLDDFTSKAWTINLRTKDAALPAMKQFIAMAETQYQVRIAGVMSDAGGEFKSNAFIEMLKDRGIKILQSIPHVHQQNGRAERLIRTLMEKAESIRLQACLPQSWWEFALDHATHVYN